MDSISVFDWWLCFCRNFLIGMLCELNLFVIVMVVLSVSRVMVKLLYGLGVNRLLFMVFMLWIVGLLIEWVGVWRKLRLCLVRIWVKVILVLRVIWGLDVLIWFSVWFCVWIMVEIVILFLFRVCIISVLLLR